MSWTMRAAPSATSAPASVSVMARVLRCTSFVPRRVSSEVSRLLTAVSETPQSRATWVRLVAWATRSKKVQSSIAGSGTVSFLFRKNAW
jgi:hypothetical protein